MTLLIKRFVLGPLENNTYLLTDNNSKEAISLFQTEAKIYPESKLLMDRLIQMANKKDPDSSPISNSTE